MEEMRARSGAAQIATGIFPRGSDGQTLDYGAGPAAADSPAHRLARAKEMLSEGLITDAEYEAIKAKIIGAL
jgi:hypothetical protein